MSIPTIKDWRETISTVKRRFVMKQLNSCENNRWTQMDNDDIQSILEGIDEKYINRGYSTWTLKLMGYEGPQARIEMYQYFVDNALNTKLKLAWMYAILNKLHEDGELGRQGFSFDFDDVEIRFNSMTQSNYPIVSYGVDKFEIVRLEKAMQEARLSSSDIKNALGEFAKIERTLAALRNNDRLGLEESPGFKKLMDARPTVHDVDATVVITEQMTEYKKLLTNNLTARTWGFEIEVPDAKGVDAPNGIEKGDDGSLRSYNANDDCECDCSECTYHSCDCEWCENQNDDPEHCGNNHCASCDSAEYRSIGGIQRMRHAGMIELCKELNEVDAEKNESAGTHVHVWARDLTAHQVAQVMAIYQWNYWILSVVAGRENVSYAKRIPNAYVTRLLSKKNPQLTLEKPVAVNLTPLFTDRGTIEFRQMDCNLDQDLILFWAWLVRGIVNAAKRGAHFSDFKNVKDLKDIITVFDKYNHTLYSETPDDVVYGSRTDANRMVKPVLKQYAGRR